MSQISMVYDKCDTSAKCSCNNILPLCMQQLTIVTQLHQIKQKRMLR